LAHQRLSWVNVKQIINRNAVAAMAFPQVCGVGPSAWLARAEWAALWWHVQQRTTPPETPPGVRQAVRWIAQLGGFMARKGDGEPGPLALWRACSGSTI
jgi:hypothetical protein